MKYTEEHEWLRPEGDVIVVVITEHAATQLGDIVFVELPEVGIPQEPPARPWSSASASPSIGGTS